MGKWRSVTTTRGGIGAVYEFSPNGSVTYSSAALADLDYTQDGSQITLGGQRAGFGWHPDGRLQLNFGNGEVENFTREDKAMDSARALIGEFRGTRTIERTRVPVIIQLKESQRALVVLFLKTVSGRYRPTAGMDSEWTMTLPPLPERRLSHDKASGNLIITAIGGDPHPFARF